MGSGWCDVAGTMLTRATSGGFSKIRDVNPRRFGGPRPEWNRECPVGVPLVCPYFNPSRTLPFLARAGVTLLGTGLFLRVSPSIFSPLFQGT